MKNVFLFVFLLGATLFGTPIQIDEQFKEAVHNIGEEDKYILMIYTATDCPECAYMKQKVFHDKSVEPYLTRYFVVIEKNIHKDKLPDGFDYFGIPTMFFIDKFGVKKETVVGSKRPKAFLDVLQQIRVIK